MEANGKQIRLEEAKGSGEKIKLIFQYPGRDRATIKSGFVVDVFHDCFFFEEKFDGGVTYGYKFLEEIKKEDRV